MKTIRLLLLFATLPGWLAVAREREPAREAAGSVTIQGLLISASNERGESDRRLATYVPNLRRILRFESFRLLGENSATIGVPGQGHLVLGSGNEVELTTEKGGDGKTVLLKVRWAAGSVRHEYVLQRGVPTVLGGPSSGRKGEMLAVMLIDR